MALVSMLAFWTGGDKEQMDRLFRQSGLMRAKWDERLRGALEAQREENEELVARIEALEQKVETEQSSSWSLFSR